MSSLLPRRVSPFRHLGSLLQPEARAAHPLVLAERVDPEIQRPLHLEYLSIAVARCIHTPRGRLIVSMPPRHGKSKTCSVWAPIWTLEEDARREIMLMSYESDFAQKWGREVRDTIEGNPDKLSTRIKQTSRAAKRWDTTAGGGMVVAGAGGSMTGRGADVFIVDDPHKNADDAQSVTNRQKVWDLYTTTVRTRMSPGGSIIIIMTRWHEDDLVGSVLQEDGDRWEVVTFPAIANEGDILGRQPGDALWPERYDLEELSEARTSYATWESLYQQNPTPIMHDQLAFDPEVVASHKARWACRPAAVGSFETDSGVVSFVPGIGKWSIWRAPEQGRSYLIAADPCGDGNGRDNAHAVIMDLQSGEECASFHGRVGPAKFGKELVKAGYVYCGPQGRPALIAVEGNSEGSSAITILAEYHYPRIWQRQRFDSKGRKNVERLGWYSSGQTKTLAVTALTAGLVGEVVIHDHKVFDEMSRFARTPNGGFEATKGNDDCVMAWGIACAVRKYGTYLPQGAPKFLPAYKDASERDPVTGY